MTQVVGAVAVASKATPPAPSKRDVGPERSAPDPAVAERAAPDAPASEPAKPFLTPSVRSMIFKDPADVAGETGAASTAQVIAQLIDALRAYEAGRNM